MFSFNFSYNEEFLLILETIDFISEKDLADKISLIVSSNLKPFYEDKDFTSFNISVNKLCDISIFISSDK